jgi:hypothetical protein
MPGLQLTGASLSLCQLKCTKLPLKNEEDQMADDNKVGGNSFDLSAMTAVAAAYQKKLLEFAQANAQASFQFTSEMMTCRTPADFIRVTQEQSKRQLETFQQQAKELMELAKPGGN